MLLIQTMSINIQNVRSAQPFIIFPQMQKVPISFYQHFYGHVMSKFRLQITLFTIPTYFGLLVLLLLIFLSRSFL